MLENLCLDASQVCDNVGDHLIGNVYARYEWETEAQAAVDNLNDRWYAGKSRVAKFTKLLSAHRTSKVALYMLSSLLLPISGKPAVVRMRMVNVTEVASVTSCTFALPQRS